MRLFIIVTLLAGCLLSCKKDKKADGKPSETSDSTALVSAKITGANNPGKDIATEITCTIAGDSITALVPYAQNDKKLVINFTPSNKDIKVKVNDTLQVSGITKTDFSKPVIYKLMAPNGESRTYRVIIRNFTGLPVLYLTTSGPVVSKDQYVTGTMVINTNGRYEQEKLTIPLQIKGRGNTTWNLPKKPYRLKFNDKAAMLGLQPAKNWVLLANYSDKTLMRVSLAFLLGRMVNADYTNHARPVEVVMNGEYLGSYLLTEQVEVHENRVNVPELKKDDNSPEKITGGYLIEFDSRLDGDVKFITKMGARYIFQSPEEPSPQQYTYITNYLQQFEDSMFAPDFTDPENGYAKYINVGSFISWCLVQEFLKNNDANLASSIFYYKDRDGKLGMGPIWDFDISAGNINYNGNDDPEGWWIPTGAYFKRLFQDPAFKDKFKAKWSAFRNNDFDKLMKYIDDNAEYLRYSQEQNFKKWPILNQYVWPNPVVLGSYDKEVNYLKQWLINRANWIDANINN